MRLRVKLSTQKRKWHLHTNFADPFDNIRVHPDHTQKTLMTKASETPPRPAGQLPCRRGLSGLIFFALKREDHEIKSSARLPPTFSIALYLTSHNSRSGTCVTPHHHINFTVSQLVCSSMEDPERATDQSKRRERLDSSTVSMPSSQLQRFV